MLERSREALYIDPSQVPRRYLQAQSVNGRNLVSAFRDHLLRNGRDVDPGTLVPIRKDVKVR